MVVCTVQGCKNRSKRGGVSFHEFPADVKRRKLWMDNLRRESWPKSFANLSVCGNHFTEGHPCSTPSHPDYAPTLNLGHSNFSLNKDDAKLRATPKVKLSRFDHVQSGMKRKMKDSRPNEGVKKSRRSVDPNKNVEVLEQPEAVVPAGDVDTSATFSHDACKNEMVKLREEKVRLLKALETKRREIETLEEKVVSMSFGEHRLIEKHVEEKTKFYTGIPKYKTFVLLCQMCEAKMPRSDVLSIRNIFLMVMMKLRRGYDNYDLADRFRVSKGHVTSLLKESLPMIRESLGFLVKWPTKEAVQKTMPNVFTVTKYSTTRCIIDSIKLVFQPSSISSAVGTHCNETEKVVKFLIGVSPLGGVTFVSNVNHGNINDSELIQKCGILQLVDNGDIVLTARGFGNNKELKATETSIPHVNDDISLTTLHGDESPKLPDGSITDSASLLNLTQDPVPWPLYSTGMLDDLRVKGTLSNDDGNVSSEQSAIKETKCEKLDEQNVSSGSNIVSDVDKDAVDEQSSRKVSRLPGEAYFKLNNHVERSVRRLKEFKILNDPIDITLAPSALSIIKICSALTNLSPQFL